MKSSYYLSGISISAFLQTFKTDSLLPTICLTCFDREEKHINLKKTGGADGAFASQRSDRLSRRARVETGKFSMF